MEGHRAPQCLNNDVAQSRFLFVGIVTDYEQHYPECRLDGVTLQTPYNSGAF